MGGRPNTVSGCVMQGLVQEGRPPPHRPSRPVAVEVAFEDHRSGEVKASSGEPQLAPQIAVGEPSKPPDFPSAEGGDYAPSSPYEVGILFRTQPVAQRAVAVEVRP